MCIDVWLPVALWHWAARRLPDWHWTAGWGNLTTVAVAIAAIIVSIVTLGRNAAQFRQQRRDSRTDKLRAEIADLISALYERQRLRDIMAPIADPGAIDLENRADSVATDLVENLSGPDAQAAYQRAMAHTFAIKMLTDDETINRLVNQIGQAISAELGDINATLTLASRFRRTDAAAPLVEDARARSAERDEREAGIKDRVQELVNYGVTTLRKI